MPITIDIFVILWYIYTVCDPFTMSRFKTLLASSMIGTSLLGMPALAWESQDSSVQQVCIPQLSVVDNTVDNTIRIQIAEGNTCPISDKVFLFIQDNRPQSLKLPGFKESFFSSTWVVSSQGVRSGQYRVMGINPTPNGIGDNEYISARHLRIDQVITVGGNRGQEQSSPALPPVVLPPAPQPQVTTLDPESKHLLRNFDQWMRWFQVNIWPQLQNLIRAIEGIKAS